MSIWSTRLSSRAQLMRAGRLCVQPDSVAVSSDLPVTCPGAWGTTSDITMWVVPSRQAVLSLSATCPALSICKRSLLRS